MGFAFFFAAANFLVSAFMASQSVWRYAAAMSVLDKELDYERIHQNIKSRILNRKWLLVTSLASLSIFLAMTLYSIFPDNEKSVDGHAIIATLLGGFGIVAEFTVIVVQAKELFYTSVKELGIIWPPSKR